MIKHNESNSANVNVLGDDQLSQVVGGHHGGHRRRNYGHCYKNDKNRQYNGGYNYDAGYEGKGYGEDSYDSDFSNGDS